MPAIMLPFSPVSSRKSTSFARALLSCLSVGYFSHHRAFFLHFKEFLHLFLFLATSFLSSLFLVDISLISIKPFSVSCNARSKPHAMHLAWSWSFPWPLLTFGAIIKVDDQWTASMLLCFRRITADTFFVWSIELLPLGKLFDLPPTMSQGKWFNPIVGLEDVQCLKHL
jgi:hypothetical protein